MSLMRSEAENSAISTFSGLMSLWTISSSSSIANASNSCTMNRRTSGRGSPRNEFCFNSSSLRRETPSQP